jgi:RHS repeat-associated protein
MVLTLALLAPQVPGVAQAAPRPFTPAAMPSVPGRDWIPGNARGSTTAIDPTAAMASMAAPAVAWPQPATVDVDLTGAAAGTAKAAGGTPVRLAAVARPVVPVPGFAPPPGPGRLRVQVYDRAIADRARVDGVLLRVTGATGAGPVTVTVDYGGFRHAYGGDWAGRLRFVRLPECALTTPDATGCAGQVLATRNDVATGTLSADVSLGAATASLSASTSVSGTVLLAALAGDSSSFGDFRATELTPSGSWSAGGSSGDFAWSYPLRMPPSLGGPTPQVGFSYSAQSVDGKTAATNAQPSWIGEGFDFWPGSIERAYKQCSDDGQSSTLGDECWGGDNATLTMSGRGGELIQDATTPTIWRPRNDDGSKVEKITTSNGDNDGEAWLLTTQDGSRFYFGLNKLPGAPAASQTKSAWTVPVFGDDANEPCHQSTFAASVCTQAYRWNLDYIVDPVGNTMSIWYDQETNKYARNHTDTTVSTYVRAGAINHIEYGTRQDPTTGNDSTFTTSAPQRVDFATLNRCITQGSTCTSSTPSNWPDVPWDRNCSSSTNCAGKYSPTFWSTKRLSTVTTRVWGGSAYRDVERWTLTTEFRDPGDGNPKVLWLKSLSHTGLTPGYTANSALPDVTFGAVAMSNRVDVSTTTNPIWRFRMASVTSESGGVVSVAYLPAECRVGGTMPSAPESNTRRCFPAYWVKPGATGPSLEYFHRYVVASVTESDQAAGGLPVSVSYKYLDPPAWHYDDNEFVPPSKRTYGQWRGYSKVRTIFGQAGTTQTQSDALYFRGMNGDKLPSGTRSASVVDSFGTSIPDEAWRAGATREQIAYTGVSASGAAYGTGAPILNRTVNDPWEHGPTATRTRNGVTVKAYLSNIARTTTYSTLDGGRPDQVTRVSSTFDGPTGRVLTVDDEGDVATTADDTCTRNEYAENAGRWMRAYLSRVERVSVRCAVTPDRSTQVISDTRSWFDGATSYDRTVSKGKITRTQELADWNNGNPIYVTLSRNAYDEHGRVVDTYDALDHRTRTAFTPAVGGPVTTVTVTNPLGWQTVSAVEPAWGVPTRVVDPNGRVTDYQFDTLGRQTAVWTPGRDKANQTASATFTYQVRNTAPTVITTATLNTTGTAYLTGYALYDGLMRSRQSQSPSATGTGRVITDTIYDYRGKAWKNNQPYYNSAAPSATLFVVADASVPAQVVSTYDNAGRQTSTALNSYNVEQFRTTTAYGGDRAYITPPTGGTATTTITDARGEVVEFRQHQAATPTGSFDATTYTYTPAGNLATITDPALNVWRSFYDQRGRRVRVEDPDAGTSRTTYNDTGARTSTTDARGVTVSYDYDVLGRTKSTWRGAVGTGTMLTELAYDSLAKGQLTSATRWDGGYAYVTAVTGYDPAYHPTGTSVTIPAVEGDLARTYTGAQTYNVNGSVATTTVPAAGGLPEEVLTYGYTSTGLPKTTSGLSSYVVGTTYDPLGRLQEAILSDGVRSLVKDFVYDPATGRLTRNLTWGDTAPQVLADTAYTYDATGNVLAVFDQLAQYGGTNDNQCFRYDYLHRLTQAWTPANGDCAATATLAGLGGPAPYWLNYTYDTVGNRRLETRHRSGGDTQRTYDYPPAGSPQPHTLTRVTTTGPGAGVVNYDYDDAGNTISRGTATGDQTVEWDTEGHLSRITQGSAVTSLLYDAFGGRLIRRDASGTRLYLGDQEVLLSPTGTLSGTRSYGGHAVRTSTGGLSWLASDHQGTSTFAVRASDLAVTGRRQLPFGESRGGAPANWPDQKGFVGGTNDSTGLTELGARTYDATIGRFISVDPIVEPLDPQQLHGYAYANNTPVTGSDPDGQDWLSDLVDAAVAAATQGATQGAQAVRDRHPRDLHPGEGPNQNIYLGLFGSGNGKGVPTFVRVTDGCRPPDQSCILDQNRIFDVEILGPAISCQGWQAAASPCYLGRDGAIHDFYGHSTGCSAADKIVGCVAGPPSTQANPVIRMHVDMRPYKGIYLDRCPGLPGPPPLVISAKDLNNPGIPADPQFDYECPSYDFDCNLENLVGKLDDWFGAVPGVGDWIGTAQVLYDIRNGDWTAAAVDAASMATGNALGDMTESAVGKYLMKTGARRFAHAGGVGASMATQETVKIICVGVPEPQQLMGFCLF